MERKICTKCGEEKPLEEYAYKNKPKGIKKPHCKECDKVARRQYYLDNKERIVEDILIRNKEKKKRNYTFLHKYLETHHCVDCGNDNPIVLEFDHRDNVDKVDSISKMCSEGRGIESIKKEIDKCDVRCSNCHKIRTAKQMNWFSYLDL